MRISKERMNEIEAKANEQIIAFDEDSKHVAFGFEVGAEWADCHPSKDTILGILNIIHKFDLDVSDSDNFEELAAYIRLKI